VSTRRDRALTRLEGLWRLVDAASTVRDIATETRVMRFAVPAPVTFYLHAEHVTVTIRRVAAPLIEVRATLYGAPGWRLASDQDDAGVYVVARRRAFVGSVSFDVQVPPGTYLHLNLEHGQLRFDRFNGILDLPIR
jgi:hypothetical protein